MTLTERHRIAQARLGSQVTAALIALWRGIDPISDADFARWLTLATATIAHSAERSADLAAGYYATIRGDGYTPVVMAAIDEPRVLASLSATGPAAMRRAIGNGARIEQAAATAQATSSAAGMRHALNAGRTTVLSNVTRDPQCYGWRRAVASGACRWCSARSGQVVRGESVDFHAHDGCGCAAEPLFR